MNSLSEFIESSRRNTWLDLDIMHVYVRKSKRRLNGSLHCCFDVASVEVIEDNRGKGLFTSWITELETLLPSEFEYIFVECVLNERLVPHLEKLGYTNTLTTPTPDLYKEIS